MNAMNEQTRAAVEEVRRTDCESAGSKDFEGQQEHGI